MQKAQELVVQTGRVGALIDTSSSAPAAVSANASQRVDILKSLILNLLRNLLRRLLLNLAVSLLLNLLFDLR